MNKTIIYSFLLLLYLVLSKSLAPSEYKISYMMEEQKLSELITTYPASAILVDVHSTGLIIKTYYLKFRVVYGFQAYEELIVKSSSALKNKLESYVGLSVFRKEKEDSEPSFVPLPPGTLFINKSQFGKWNKKDEWVFFRSYRNIPKSLGWGDFVATRDFYFETQAAQKQSRLFAQSDFGIKGIRTQNYFPHYFNRINEKPMNWKTFVKNYFHNNFASSGLKNE